MKVPNFATHYENRLKKRLDCSDSPSMTQQQYKDESDINNILRRYEKTGILPDLIKENPKYGDFSDVPSYQEAFDLVEKAHLQFASLDAHVRRRFDNDPEKFLDFAQNPSNLKEMVDMGLAVARKPINEPTEPLKNEVKP